MQDLIRHLPAVIYEYSIQPDGRRRFDYISEAANAIFGISPQVIMDDPVAIERVIHPDDIDDLRNSSELCQQQGEEWNWQGRAIVQNQVRWIEIRSNHEVTDKGVIIRRGIVQDITKRREIGRESEVRYQSLVDHLPIGIIIHNHGTIVFANMQAHVILAAGKTQELIGSSIHDIVDNADISYITGRPEAIDDSTPWLLVEQQYKRLDGKSIQVESTSLPYEYKGESCVQIVFRDITANKLAETRIKKNETLLAQLFATIPMAVVLLTDSGKVAQVNKGFEEMFGYTMADMKDKSVNDFIVPEELTHEGVDLHNLVATNRVISIETVRRHRSGKLVNVILYGMPVMFDNQAIGIYGVYIDITERKRVEEELKIRNAELDNFVYKVSHDLRAPLSSILGLVNLAKLPGNTDDPMEYISIIGAKVAHLDNFIGDVLSHSKNLKMDVSIAKVEFNHIIEETFNDLNYLEGAKGIRRIVKIDGIEFYNDPWRIAEIVRNLISNAIKYRKLDQVTSEIGIRINVDHMRAEISFVDNGIGIDEENLARVFEMFYRATEQSDGSGIGLYIVRNAVEKLGGQITVASRVGQGTRFNILLPNRINNVIATVPSSVDLEE